MNAIVEKKECDNCGELFDKLQLLDCGGYETLDQICGDCHYELRIDELVNCYCCLESFLPEKITHTTYCGETRGFCDTCLDELNIRPPKQTQECERCTRDFDPCEIIYVHCGWGYEDLCKTCYDTLDDSSHLMATSDE